MTERPRKGWRAATRQAKEPQERLAEFQGSYVEQSLTEEQRHTVKLNSINNMFQICFGAIAPFLEVPFNK